MTRPVIGSRYEPPTRYTHDPDMEHVQKGLLKPARGPLRPWRINWWLFGAAAVVTFTLTILT